MDRLEQRLIEDIKKIGLPTDFKLDLRGYSKTYNGRYNTRLKKVMIYPLKKNGELRDYKIILRYLIHEVIHHYQWNYEENFVRVKGVMHDTKFYELENNYLEKAKNLGLLN